MIADRLLCRLEGVRQTGPGRWRANCLANDGIDPGLSGAIALVTAELGRGHGVSDGG